MKFTFVGDHFTISDRLQEEAELKLSRLDTYINEDNVNVRVVLSENPNSKAAEVTIFLKDGVVLRAEEAEEDIYTALDRAVDALKSQLRKHKTKLMNRYQGSETIRFDNIDDIEEDEKDEDPKIVKTKSFAIKPMHPEEATLQMELVGHDFFVFLNGETGEVNVVYKRKDGNYGLIEPTF